MAKKKVDEDVITPEHIENQSLDFVMGDRYAIYAKYVIQDRAIPDARDGLKPVQRRIIYSMAKSGNTFDKDTKKCATIVGAVMGKYHPHGDSSIYDALVRMSQPWKMNMPLIKFQGNNGSIDNDPAAAHRYTEAKLNEFAMNLVSDIDKNTVDMMLNFDDTELEPIVLPARFPNLFVNGSEGIAVAIATEIPPHNLREIIEATIYRMYHPSCSIEELLNIVKGPDFPTGGIIYDSQGLKDIYFTGRGKIEIASKVDVIIGKDSNFLIITEIPYKVVKQDLVFSIDKIRKNREIDGIVEVIDESAGEDIKISIELRKEVDPNVVLTYLFNKTQLKVNYSANVVAISHDRPKTLTLSSYLDTYIDHQVDVIRRRSQYLLDVSKNRLHIVDGLIHAVNIIDEIVALIRGSKDKKDAKNNLINKFNFSEEQAEAIVMMHLYKLSNTDVNIYINEKKDLEDQITELSEILTSESKLKRVIANDLKKISEKYGIERRTLITEENQEVSIEKRDLIIKEDVFVCVTREGYAKRSSIKSYKASNSLPGVKEGDTVILQTLCNTGDYILAFTDKGNYLFIPVHELCDIKWKDEGKHINSFINLPIDEYIIRCILVKDFDKNVNIVLASKNGQIKKTSLKEFFATRYSKPITCMKLLKGDEVADVAVANGNSNLLLITKSGVATCFNESEISCTGLKTSGVKSISTLKNSTVNSLFTFRNNERNKLFLITKQGMLRIFDSNNVEITNRLGKTQIVFKSFKSDPHELAYANKIINTKDPHTLTCVMSDNSTMTFTMDDYHLTPIDKVCKKNLSFDDSLLINYVYEETVQTIDKDTIEEQPLVKDDESNTDFEDYEQISIFDDMGD
ncbi:MAG: DNA topoisomerase IV subunit A [Candidatus Onthovivens sp.]|nr:DNA topoisomerase IV subunit A [Candidatus Onthovivens sp.]